MNSELRCLLCLALLCASASMSAAVAADHVSPNDSTDTKISVVPEPTESPRYLHDEH